MRKMGGLKERIPFTYAMMVVGTLALTGFPLTAGYFSKDAIIEAAYRRAQSDGALRLRLTVIAALLTSFYSWRLIFKTFHGEPHDRKHWRDAHESPLVMLIPLGVLALGSIFAGYPFKAIFVGHGVEEFFRESLTFAQGNHVLEDMEHIPFWIGLSADRHDGDRLPDRLALLHPPAGHPGRARARSTGCSTGSCSTNGTSTSSTTSSSSARRSGSAAPSGRAATAGSSTASARTACPRACSTSPAASCGCRPATSITTPSPC